LFTVEAAAREENGLVERDSQTWESLARGCFLVVQILTVIDYGLTVWEDFPLRTYWQVLRKPLVTSVEIAKHVLLRVLLSLRDVSSSLVL
jgi:hypothetical protein